MDGWVPIACSLEGGEARRRSEDWGALRDSRTRVERSDHGFKLQFVANDATRSELTRLVVAERQCCGFVEWELEDLGDELALIITGDPTGVAAMAEAFHLNG